MSDAELTSQLIQTAVTQWLSAPHVLHLLQQCTEGHLAKTAIAYKPKSGSLFLISKTDSKAYGGFKADGYVWKKKKGSNAVRKDVTRLKIEKVEVIETHYYHCDTVQTFKKRVYLLLEDRSVILVHYLDTDDDKPRHSPSCPCLLCIRFPNTFSKPLSPDFGEIGKLLDDDQDDNLIPSQLYELRDVCIKDFVPRTLAPSEFTKVMICLCMRDGSPVPPYLLVPSSDVQVILPGCLPLNAVRVIPGVFTVMCPPYSGGETRLLISVLVDGKACPSYLVEPNSPAKAAVLSYNVTHRSSKSVRALAGLEAKRKREERQAASLEEMGEEELSDVSEVVLERVVSLLIDISKEEKGLANELDSLDESGYGLLHYTVIYNHERLVALLLDHGANVNTPTGTGDTALHFAVENASVSICQLLLQKGADPTLRNGFGFGSTPVEIAQDRPQADVLNMLRSWTVVEGVKNEYLLDEGVLSETSDDVCAQKREDIHANLLREAFASMSLRDRCALSLVQRGRSGSDVQSIVSDNQESLQAAMAAMHESERAELEEEARKIQVNFRKWMLRKNVERTCRVERSAINSLAKPQPGEEQAAKVQAVDKGFTPRKDYMQARQEVIQLQAATRGILARREFKKIRSQVNSILVIQRSVRARQQRKKTSPFKT